jgi:hypothetical protein
MCCSDENCIFCAESIRKERIVMYVEKLKEIVTKQAIGFGYGLIMAVAAAVTEYGQTEVTGEDFESFGTIFLAGLGVTVVRTIGSFVADYLSR